MRLIDADALMDKMRRNPLFERTERDKGMFYVERSVINVMPTIDAVEVVRCKDCKHRHSSEFCECREPDAFCSDGERKE